MHTSDGDRSRRWSCRLRRFPRQARARIRAALLTATAIVLLLVGGCAGARDQRALAHWRQVEDTWYGPHDRKRAAAEAASAIATPDMDLPAAATLDDYLRFAARHNPGLAAAFHRWRAALAQVPQARSLPDPQVSFGIVLDEVDRSATYMGERYSLAQMFPWFGTRQLRGDVALEDAVAAGQRFEAARRELVVQVTRAYTEYAYLEQAVQIARDNRELLVRLESVVGARYRAGTASQADLIRAQVELDRAEDFVQSLADIRGAAAAELNAALGRPVLSPLPAVPGSPAQQALAPLPELADEQWLTLATDRNPELAAMRREAAGRNQAITLARRQYYPDIMVGIEYARDGGARMAQMDGGGADMVMGMVSINLPLWRGGRAGGVQEALARYGDTTSRIRERELGLAVELKLALFAYRDSRRKLELYGGALLPKARQSLATTETAYRVGEAGFTDLVDAQRIVLEFALAYERAAADGAQAAARLGALVGRLPESVRE
ncbi:MAG: TolC family protein [Candidatus Krumholzibacteria bacterium]|jgi:outer membrane protein TolC|nr:TolC family protein [Candidatus Krumholzibacteria bacterium]